MIQMNANHAFSKLRINSLFNSYKKTFNRPMLSFKNILIQENLNIMLTKDIQNIYLQSLKKYYLPKKIFK